MKNFILLGAILLLSGCDSDPIKSIPEPAKEVGQVQNFTRYQTPNHVNYYVDEFYTPSGVHCVSITGSGPALSCDFRK